MAQDALKNAQHDELRGLARAISADQAAEITEMEGDLQAWYGEDSTRYTTPRRMMVPLVRHCGWQNPLAVADEARRAPGG